MKKTAKKKSKIIASVFSYLLLAVMFILLLFVLTARFQGKTPSLFGYRIYTVVSGSMQPELEIKDVILSKKAKASELAEGDIVTYVGETGSLKGKLVTHKIERIFEEDGTLYVITKGTANEVSDPKIAADKISSVMTRKLKAVSGFFKFANTLHGFIIVIVTPLAAVLVFEIISIIKKKKSTVPPDSAGEDAEKKKK